MFAPVGARPGAIKVPPGPIPPRLVPPGLTFEDAAAGATVARPPGVCAEADDDIAIAMTAMMQDVVLSMGLTLFAWPLNAAMRRQLHMRH